MAKTISLNQNTLFRRLYYRGKNIVLPNIAVYFMRNAFSYNRLGITVSSKIGKAVVRNRVRRRIREAYRSEEPQLKTGYDIVIAARRAIVDAPYAKIANNLHRAFEKGNLTEHRKT